MKKFDKFVLCDTLKPWRETFKTKMKRVHTNKRIDRAGENLAKFDINDECVKEDIKIINEWREAHTLALENLVDLVQKRAKQVGGKTTLVSRLKKMESIKLKLTLAKNSQLSRMQDIGGCRLIVEDIKKLPFMFSRIAKFHKGFDLVKIDDYISTPKPNGYRGVHFVFKDRTKDDEYKILLELQLRTHLQHSWATAVEIAGLFNNSAFKSNQSNGHDEWMDFFKLVSYLFEYDEKGGVKNKKIEEAIYFLKKFERDFNFIRKLKGYNISTKFINEYGKGNEHFLLVLNLEKGILNIHGFNKNQLEQAQQLYFDYEAKNDGNMNVVLVSASKFSNIKDGYLNYFADSNYFIRKYNELIKKYSR